MRILVFTYLAVCLWSVPAQAQQFLLDSLQKILPATKHPIQKVDVYLGLARASVFTGQTKLADGYADQALSLSKIQKYPDGQVMAYLFKHMVADEIEPAKSYFYLEQAQKIAQLAASKSVRAFVAYHLAQGPIYYRNDYKSGIKILQRALKEAEGEQVADKHLGNIHKTMANAYQWAGDEKQALQHFQKALDYFERVKKQPFIVPELGRASWMDADGGEMNKIQVMLYTARIYHDQGRFEESATLIQAAYHLSGKYQLRDCKAWANEEMALIHTAKGHLDQALESYQEAAKLYTQLGSKESLAATFREQGSLYYRLEDWDEAERHFLKALSLCREFPDTLGMIYNYSRLGQVASSQQKWAQAMQNHQEAARLNHLIGDSINMAYFASDIGVVLQGQQKFRAALQQFHKAQKLNQRFNNQQALLNNSLQMAETYLGLNQLDSARHFATLANDLSAKIGTLDQQRNVQLFLSQLSAKNGDYQSALAHHQAYFALHDSIFTVNAQAKFKAEQVRQNVADYQEKKEQAEKEAQLLNVQNRLYLILLVGLLAVIALVSFLFWQLRKAQKQLQTQNQQLQALNATKDKFFGIIAHDIRSPIVALEGVGEQMAFYLKKQQFDKLERLSSRVDQTASQLSKLLDNLLNWALLQQGTMPYRPQAIKVRDIAGQVLDMYEASASAKEIKIFNQVEQGLEAYADENSLQVILRNLVGNAIKFTPNGGQVSIGANTNGPQIQLSVNDSGTGIALEKQAHLFSLDRKSEKGTNNEKGTGLGLMLVKEFAALNKGFVNVESQLNIGTKFTVSLPAT